MELLIVVVIAVLAVGAVILPFMRRPDAGAQLSEAALNEEVARYREALRAGTLCEDCLTANPPDSRFCADCGAYLP